MRSTSGSRDHGGQRLGLSQLGPVPAGQVDHVEVDGAGELRQLATGNTVIVGPNGMIIAGPVHEAEETLIADLDLAKVASGRRLMDPTGHYHRPDIFQLHVDTTSRGASGMSGQRDVMRIERPDDQDA